jgi:hypothetical protein
MYNISELEQWERELEREANAPALAAPAAQPDDDKESVLYSARRARREPHLPGGTPTTD